MRADYHENGFHPVLTSGPVNVQENIRIVLVSPIYGGNVGSVCRAMMNMGLSDLVIAAPREEFNSFDAMKWSYSARSIWESHRVCSTLREAVADCNRVAGATVREGLYRQDSRTPREWAPILLDSAREGRVALVFGPENNGLSNDDVAHCTELIRIPSSDAYPSLNLSHAVMVCAYEMYIASGTFVDSRDKDPEAPSELRERMYDMWRDALLKIGFMDEEKADHMMMALRRILSRGKLTETDTRILMGIARQTQWFSGKRE